jgi:molecular chaperone DnaJ
MNYYEILGVEKTASQDEISSAYREKAKNLHPDKNSGDASSTAKFKDASKAFEVLSNPEKRAVYDRGGDPNNNNSFGMNDWFHHFNVQDIFGHHGPMGRERGLDINVSLSITLEESYKGCIKDVKIKIKDRCQNCDSGILNWETCVACGGSGSRQMQQGPWIVNITCDKCQGQRRTPKTKCDKCLGTGLVGDKEETVKVEIPAGVDNLMEMRLANQGAIGASGRRGNLHVKISVLPHNFLVRKGIDLICRTPVSYTQLIFGDKIKIPTFNGSVEVTIPPRTMPDKKLKLKGMGFQNLQNPHHIGDMYVSFELDVPDILPDEYEIMLKNLSLWEQKTISLERKEFCNFAN